MNEPNIRRIADALGQAVQFKAPPPKPEPEVAMVTTSLDPDPGEPNDKGEGPGTWLPNRLGLPNDCPVTPLGVDGDTYYFLDTIGQLRALGCREFSKMSVLSLFMGRHNYLYWGWPRFNKEGKTTSFANDDVAATLMAACAAKGPWTPTDRVRGRGAWVGSKGDLIIHSGLHMWMYGRETATGEHGRYVYPKRPPALVPWPQRIEHDNNPARLLLPILRRWNWQRPDVDPVLMLGWIASAMIGGALDWRPMVYITGDRGTGKSTLQKLIRTLFGDGEGIISTTNTTAAGIYQLVGQDSLPVAIDELEGSEDNRQAKRILELARQASSGGKGLRGGDRGTGSEFSIRSPFLFSSINAPPLLPQDLSRFALLKLDKIDPSKPPPTQLTGEQAEILGREAGELTDDEIRKLGRMMLRRMVDGWQTMPAMIRAYREVLRAAGHDQRGQDTFGTLLACANMAVGDSFDELGVAMGEDLDPWREALQATGMTELENATDNWLACLEYMLTAPVDAYRNGAKLTVGRVVLAWHEKEDSTTVSETRAKLEQAGVGLSKDGQWLAVPNSSPLLHKIFLGSRWAGDAGTGVWPAALQQGPKGVVWERGHCRINGVNCRCTMISLRSLYGPSGLMRDEDQPEAML
jgi:hypothetical protein